MDVNEYITEDEDDADTVPIEWVSERGTRSETDEWKTCNGSPANRDREVEDWAERWRPESQTGAMDIGGSIKRSRLGPGVRSKQAEDGGAAVGADATNLSPNDGTLSIQPGI